MHCSVLLKNHDEFDEGMVSVGICSDLTKAFDSPDTFDRIRGFCVGSWNFTESPDILWLCSAVTSPGANTTLDMGVSCLRLGIIIMLFV